MMEEESGEEIHTCVVKMSSVNHNLLYFLKVDSHTVSTWSTRAA